MSHQHISTVVLFVALVSMALAGCGDGDSATTTSAPDDQTTISTTTISTTTTSTTQSTSTSTSSSTSTSAVDEESTSTSSAGPATVESLVAALQARLDAEFAAAPDPPPEVLGAIEVSCDRSGPLRAGDLLACPGTPRTEPGFDLDPVGLLVAVLDDEGTVAWSTGTDIPSNLDELNALTATPGLFCRDLIDPDAQAEAGFFSTTTTNESLGYFLSVMYWFIEDRQERMDEDRNGVPCETVHDPDIVASIWAGGEVG